MAEVSSHIDVSLVFLDWQLKIPIQKKYNDVIEK